ncbi:MAG: PKD domain-containing protein [Calditrichaeota bacterium]|nr:PKD domain-containing protein [Calditrichota bacterium]
MKKRIALLAFCILFMPFPQVDAQETTEFRAVNLTIDTFNPELLGLNRGRLLWKDEPPGGGDLNLWLYTGAEQVKLDSGQTGLSGAIDGDHVVWFGMDEQLKVYNLRDWRTIEITTSSTPDTNDVVALHNGFLAYSGLSNEGSEIIVHNLKTNTDTSFSVKPWNSQPSIHHGQLAWVGQDSEDDTNPSDIFYFDGHTVSNLTNSSSQRNEHPILRDGQVVWSQPEGSDWKVLLFTGDETVIIAQPGNTSSVLRGYDVSDGVCAAAVSDTVQSTSQIIIYDSETGDRITLLENQTVTSPQVDNDLVAWVLEGQEMRIKSYNIRTQTQTFLPTADAMLLDDETFAWTNGEAVEYGFQVTSQRLTDDSENGWSQTRFKNVDEGTTVWGNFENSENMRLFFHDGSTTTQLTDSSETKDFVMNNDGYVIWRNNFDFLWLYDGNEVPRQVVDSLQLENPYVAGGSVGFFGFELSDANQTMHAWLYDINVDTLIQITTGDPAPWTVLCDGNTACWLDRKDEKFYYFDGSTVSVLSEGPVDFTYDYENGKIVWSELQNGTWQVMVHDVTTQNTTQLTDDNISSIRPQTDGDNVVWYENQFYPLNPTEPLMVYYDGATGQQTKVARFYPQTDFRLPQLSNGKIAWPQNDNISVFDGQSISTLTADDFRINTEVDIDDEILLWKRTLTSPNRNGDIFMARLQPRVSFDVQNPRGNAPLQVAFSNRSWQGVQTWVWDFGDGHSSTENHPFHIYENAGVFTVTLSVTGPTGTVTERKRNLIRVTSAPTSVNDDEQLPDRHTLFQNYPNPFNPVTNLRFYLASKSNSDSNTGPVVLKIYDVLGREIVTLVDTELAPGNHVIQWDGRNASGRSVASGMYLYRLQAADFVQIKKLLLLR